MFSLRQIHRIPSLLKAARIAAFIGTPFLFQSTESIAQSIFTYGKYSVSKEEFLRAYRKNNLQEKPGTETYQQYLDLYIKYKLKVRAAYDIRLDTLPQHRFETAQFREQIIDAYLQDEASLKSLTKEAFQRAQKEWELSYLYCAFRETDTLTAWKKVQQAQTALRNGKAFSEVALQYSDDPAVNQHLGKIGYLTVFNLPYAFEQVVAELPVGKYSGVLKGKNGYFLFKKERERPASGKVRIAHILIGLQPGATAVQKKQAQAKADSIYGLLEKGMPFATAAKQFSDDNTSYQEGGQIPVFGVGVYEPGFEQTAFALKEVGSYSTPVETSYGYHILQLLERMPVPTSMDSTQYVSALQQQVSADDRILVAKQIFYEQIRKKTNYNAYPYSKKSFLRFSDSVYAGKTLPKLSDFQTETPLFRVANQVVKAKDWAKHLQVIRHVQKGPLPFEEALQKYTDQVVMEYYKAHLSEYDPGFAAQMKEFEEGNLLFAIMQQQVWDKSANDEKGLTQYYQANAEKYTWKPGVSAIFFTVLDPAQEPFVRAQLEKNGLGQWRKTLAQYEGLVQADSGRFEYEQLPVNPQTLLKPGLLTPAQVLADQTAAQFIWVQQVFDRTAPRTYAEARGYVLSDYQNYVEERWVKELAKKHPVQINQSVLNSLPR